MINAPQLLADLKRNLTGLEADLRERINALPDLKASLMAEWQAASNANRTAETFESWSDQVITQASVHWLLSCVFLRFIEDNNLVDRPWIGGTPASGRLLLAKDRHEAYFQARPLESDRDYLLACFTEAGTLPGLHTFFDPTHNPVFRLGISGDAAMALRQFWQQVDPNTGTLLHDFTDPAWNTRFLGDLYQDLSEATRKRYALLQTPEFVEEFILDRTLTPAIREFGYQTVRMIDPTCGSGHFLLGGFYRMVDEWSRAEPNRNRRDVAQKALDAVSGVDLNPFAVAISRFRLLVAALQASDVHRLVEAPDFNIHVAIGDSLLHGQRFGLSGQSGIQSDELFDAADSHAETGLAHAYASEDLALVQRILGRQYHAVVGNPPYIIVRDAALNAAYRSQYASCHRKYSLGAPFTERFFELAIAARDSRNEGTTVSTSAGFVGLITANSFMKREFGSKLIEQVLPRLDLTHVVDTSGAYIPGHGTPTVILFGRHRPPVGDIVRAVMSIKGEPSTPLDPAFGVVWSAILSQIDLNGSQSEFVSVVDTQRSIFGKHPWSVGGGGTAELKEQLEDLADKRLSAITAATGFMVVTGEDDIFLRERNFNFSPAKVPKTILRDLVEGDAVRDWSVNSVYKSIYEYDLMGRHTPEVALDDYFWIYRSLMRPAIYFGRTKEQRGMHWREYGVIVKDKLGNTPTIGFAFVATHNHFIYDRLGRVFKQSAPVIKLSEGASEEDHLGVVGLLNSSVACFWLKQVSFNKGDSTDSSGARTTGDVAFDTYEFTSTKIAGFPLVENRPVELSIRLETLARQLAATQPATKIATIFKSINIGSTGTTRQEETECSDSYPTLPTRANLDAARATGSQLRNLMIANQEELDWRCYRLYGLLPAESQSSDFEYAAPPEVALGERAFEIVLARGIAAGTQSTTWFARHGSTPTIHIPSHWPEDYRQVVQHRIDLIESDRNIRLIERPEYKRRWNSPQWNDLEQAALRDWLLSRLELSRYWPASADQPPQLTSTSRLADAVQRDADFMQIATLYAGHADFDLPQLVAELVAAEAVPALPVQRYTDTGLRKRAQWQDTWALQRREDAIDLEVDSLEQTRRLELLAVVKGVNESAEPGADAFAWVKQQLDNEFVPLRKARKAAEIGTIPVPPKYQSKDFLKADVWRLRGGLDVPKERWVSYPGCERGSDGSLVIAWAGWNHLQQATAVAAYYLDMKDNDGWEPARLQPLLASLLELVPWLEQWHNEVDPVYGERMGHYYKGFVTDEARALGFTLDDLRAWKPVAATATRRRRRVTT